MKKTNKKKLGNKGFSLVELIVVIAIMAILVGVLAPSLLKNVEKSREAKDINNLDTIYGAIQHAYADEKAVAAVPSGADTTWTLLDNTALTSANDFYAAVKDNLGTSSVPTFSSKASKAEHAAIYYKVSTEGKVSVILATSTSGPAIVGTYNTFMIE